MVDFPAIPQPEANPESLQAAVLALKECVENLIGTRGPERTTAATSTNLEALSETLTATITTLDGDTTDALALKADIDSAALTGTPTAPTAAPGTNTTQLATTAFAAAADALKANLASPALTGTPTAPTAADGTNTTQIATTAFVISNGTPWGIEFQAADQSVTSSTTMVDITDLNFAMAANTTYVFRAKLFMTAGTSGGIRLGVNGPSSPTKVRSFALLSTTSTAATTAQSGTLYTHVLIPVTAATLGTGLVEMFGKIENGANAGTCSLQFAQSVSNATATVVEKGSFLEYATAT